MRYGVVVNGAAGGGRCAKLVLPVLDTLREVHTLDVRWTTGPGHATKLTRELAETGVDAVIAVGGDGTLFEVVNGLLPRQGAGPALGLLPLGTGNSFGRDFGLHELEVAQRALLAGHTRPVDAVQVLHDAGELHYINLLSLGFSAEAGSLTNRRFKPLGALGYILAVLISVARLRPRPFPYTADDAPLQEGACTLLSFCNSRYTGGDMMMAPPADPTDGQLDVVHIGQMGRRRLLTAFPRIFKGTHPEMPETALSRAASVRFAHGAPTEVMIDGEVLTLTLHTLTVLPSALEIIA